MRNHYELVNNCQLGINELVVKLGCLASLILLSQKLWRACLFVVNLHFV